MSAHAPVLLAALDAALAAADPYQAVLNAVALEGDRLQVAGARYDLAAYRRILVVGAGKATARMAQAVEHLLDGRIAAGQIVVKTGHRETLSIIHQAEAAHPIPDAAGVAGAQAILDLLKGSDDRTLVLCLLSGGASALLVAPAAGLTLHDKQEATRLLMHAGADITELNAVRKHLSAVKGGRLAQAAYPARVVALILSDVIGDPPGVIASGPTAQDDSTFADALAVIDRFDLRGKLPPRVLHHLEQGAAGQLPETLKQDAPALARTQNAIIGSIRLAMQAARAALALRGFTPRVISATIRGEARDAARMMAQAARAELAAMQPGEQRSLLYGGETTVTVRGAGLGGRNQELALAFALEIEGMQGVSLLSAGTDGTDGPTGAAGAWVDGGTSVLARKAGLDPRHELDNNNSYSFFQQLDAATGLHNHFFFDSPRIYYMHVHGHGSASELAAKVKPAIALIGAHAPAATGTPGRAISGTLNSAALANIVGYDGEQTGAVYKITIGRPDIPLKEMGAAINARMGLNTWAAFYGSDADAVVAGDIAMLDREVTPVLKSLRSSGIDVVAIHHHMTGTAPQVIFLHYWGKGSAQKLATAFRAAIDQTGARPRATAATTGKR